MTVKQVERLGITGIFLGALLLRLYALNYLPQRPITDDAYEYHYIAQNLTKAIKGELLEDKDRFLYLGAKRGWLYPLFITAVYEVSGPRDFFVRLAQVIIDALSCLLVYGIGRNIFNRRTGVTAAFLYSLYPGFIYYSTMLYQETTAIFLITLCFFSLQRAFSQKKPILYFISGILVTIITFYRSGFLFFALLTVPILFIALQSYYKKSFLSSFLCFLSGLLCMFIIYCGFSYAVSKSVNLNKPSIAWSFYETIHRDGWVSDIFAPTPTEELQEAAQSYYPPLVMEGQAQKLPPEVYLKAGILLIRKQPVQFLSQAIKRATRMWMYVETYPERWHSRKIWGQLFFHRSLIILGLLGTVLSFTLWYYCWPLYLTFLYVTSVYIPIIGIPRYAVLAMPSVIILAAHAVLWILNILANERKRLLSGKLFLIASATSITAVMALYLDVPILLAVFPHAPPTRLHFMNIVLMNVLCITSAFFLYRIFTRSPIIKSLSIYTALIPLCAVMLFYNNDALTSKTWQEWSCLLFSRHQTIKQTILLPDDFNENDYDRATLMIDMFPGGGNEYDLQVKANGELVKKYQGGIKATEKKFDNTFFGLYKSFFFDTYGLKPEDLRQWYEIDLPQRLLHNSSQLVIECSLGGIVDHKTNNVFIFGDYRISSDRNFYIGPCIPRGDEDTSLTKIMPYSGDYRFERVTPLHSIGTISAYYNGLEWQETDLSSVRGIQSGHYRIRVELIGKDGRQVVL